MSTVITLNMCKDYNIPEKYYEVFTGKYSDGFTIEDIILNKPSFLPLQMIIYILNNIPLNSKEKNKLEEILQINNSEKIFYSHHVEDCYNIKDSQYCNSSNNIENSVNVFCSFNVYNSSNINNSHDIYRSKHILNSSNIYNSNFITLSQNIKKSNYITNSFNVRNSIKSQEIYNSKYIINSSRIAFCSYLIKTKNKIGCYNLDVLNDSDYKIFDKKTNESKFLYAYTTITKILLDKKINNNEKNNNIIEFFQHALKASKKNISYIKSLMD